MASQSRRVSCMKPPRELNGSVIRVRRTLHQLHLAALEQVVEPEAAHAVQARVAEAGDSERDIPGAGLLAGVLREVLEGHGWSLPPAALTFRGNPLCSPPSYARRRGRGPDREARTLANQLFARKPLALLLEEMKGENRLRRVLGPVQLTALGVGAVFGTGIFVLTGVAAHDKTGPALMLSFLASGLACIFAALCYAEFASMAPVAGSAYTYAYATLGELFAWIIGWDLILEYPVASSTVAPGWSHYLLQLLSNFGVTLPERWTNSPIDVTQAYQFFVTGSYRHPGGPVLWAL